jgi:hypothetical protein
MDEMESNAAVACAAALAFLLSFFKHAIKDKQRRNERKYLIIGLVFKYVECYFNLGLTYKNGML